MQRIEAVDHRLPHQPVDQETMLVWIDLGFAAAGNHEMQTVRRDRPVQQMMWCARRTATGLELRIAQRADDFLFEF